MAGAGAGLCVIRVFFFGRRSILGESVFGAGAGRYGHFRGCSPTVCCVETVLGSPCRDLCVNPVVGRALVVVWCKFRKRQEREKGEKGKEKEREEERPRIASASQHMGAKRLATRLGFLIGYTNFRHRLSREPTAIRC